MRTPPPEPAPALPAPLPPFAVISTLGSIISSRDALSSITPPPAPEPSVSEAPPELPPIRALSERSP